VIDFIDMRDSRHVREVEKVLREELKKDRAKIDTSHISNSASMELSRQRPQTLSRILEAIKLPALQRAEGWSCLWNPLHLLPAPYLAPVPLKRRCEQKSTELSLSTWRPTCSIEKGKEL